MTSCAHWVFARVETTTEIMYSPSQVFCFNEALIESNALKFVTVNTCDLSGSVAIPFSSDLLGPLPTPIEKTVTPWFLSLPASLVVVTSLSD